MIVITGRTGTGKSTLINALNKRGIKKTVTDTTRSPRPGEVDGIDYNFLSLVEFDENMLKDVYAETTSYTKADGTVVRYGSRRSSYDEHGAIILNPDGVRTLRKNNVPFFCVHLDASYDTIRERIAKRGDDPADFEKRLETDEIDFLGIDLLCDLTIPTDDLTPEELADIIIDAVSVYDDDFIDDEDVSDEDLAEHLFEETRNSAGFKPEEFLKGYERKKKTFWKNKKRQEIAKLYGNVTCYKESHITKTKAKKAKKEPNYIGVVADAKKTASLDDQVRDYESESKKTDEKILIVGRTASGKDTLQYALEKRGITFVKSYSTRPPRYENEDTHIFITPEQVAPKEEMAAYTQINGYEYYATKDQVKQADAYIIDPVGLKMLVESMPETRFHILYLIPLPSMQEEMAISREEDKEMAEERFKMRSESEDAMFREFDRMIRSGEMYQNCYVTKFVNTYDDRLYAFADRIRMN